MNKNGILFLLFGLSTLSIELYGLSFLNILMTISKSSNNEFIYILYPPFVIGFFIPITLIVIGIKKIKNGL